MSPLKYLIEKLKLKNITFLPFSRAKTIQKGVKSSIYVYQTLIDVYRTSIDVYQTSIDVYQASIDVYRTSIDVYRTSIDVYQTSIDVYQTSIDVYRTSIDIYRQFRAIAGANLLLVAFALIITASPSKEVLLPLGEMLA